jgi:pyruvate/2-oxoglutarate dehydrogenase complex dihydrolipoamide acyltransferase (E2) component
VERLLRCLPGRQPKPQERTSKVFRKQIEAILDGNLLVRDEKGGAGERENMESPDRTVARTARDTPPSDTNERLPPTFGPDATEDGSVTSSKQQAALASPLPGLACEFNASAATPSGTASPPPRSTDLREGGIGEGGEAGAGAGAATLVRRMSSVLFGVGRIGEGGEAGAAKTQRAEAEGNVDQPINFQKETGGGNMAAPSTELRVRHRKRAARNTRKELKRAEKSSAIRNACHCQFLSVEFAVISLAVVSWR